MQDGKKKVTRYKITKQNKRLELDPIAIEEPLKIDIIQVNVRFAYSITMRTPGHDKYLSYGLLFTEGVITQADDVLSANHTEIESEIEANLVTLHLSPTLELALDTKQRRTPNYSGCGICGKTSLQALALKNYRNQREIITRLNVAHVSQVRRLLAKQTLFNDTGGSHVAGIVYELADGSKDGAFLDFDLKRRYRDLARCD